jgi:hypothetical protein
MNSPSSEPTDEELVALAARGELLGEIAQHFGLADIAAIRDIAVRSAALDRAGRLDLLQLVESGAVAALPTHDFFSAMHFFVGAIPELEVPLDRILAAVDALVARAGNDGMANQPFTALLTWCQRDLRRAHALLAAAKAGDPAAVPNLTFALQALDDPALARRFLGDLDDRRQASALTALSRLKDPDAVSRAETVRQVGDALEGAPSDRLCGMALECVAAVAASAGAAADPQAVTVICKALTAGGDEMRYRAADMLWTHPGILTPELLAATFAALEDVNPDHKGTIDDLDLGLSTLIGAGHERDALAFLARLLIKQRGRLAARQFDSVMHALVTGPSARLSWWVISWLLSGEIALGAALSDVLSKLERDETSLAINRADLPASDNDLSFLARKAVGWFMLQPHLAVSVLIAILGVCGDAVAQQATSLLILPMLRNYPEMAEVLAQVPKADPATPWLARALAASEAYLASARNVSPIAELQPSEARRRTQHLHHADTMRAASKAAEAQSVLLSMVHRSTMLHGVRSLSYVEDLGGGPRRPMEFELGSHEVSMALPRLDMTDPIGLQMLFANLRLETRPA